MNNKTCSLCGVVFHDEEEMCGTCRLMMSGNNDISKPVIESDLIQSSNLESPFQQSFHQPFPPAQHINSFQSNYTAKDNFQSNYQPQQSFSPPPENNSYQYTPPPRQIPQDVESQYKPSVWYWITELPTFAKIGLVVLIFSICFAIALKVFMQMDVSIQPANPLAANLEPQKPWFSSWIRSNPTGEEILEKYESVTFAKDKNLVSQSYVVSGKAQLLNKMPDGTVDLAALKKNPDLVDGKTPTAAENKIQPPPLPNNQPTLPSLPKPSDYEITFEISMKNPNKMLRKMMMKPKAGFNQTYRTFPTAGFDGAKGWSFTRTIYNGKEEVKEEPYKNNGFFANRTNDGISMTFLRSMYPKIELTGEDIIFNRRVYNVKTTDNASNVTIISFDIETGLVAKINQKGADTYVLEHKNFDGTMYPSKMVYQVNADWLMLSLEKIEPDVTLDDSIFRRSSFRVTFSSPDFLKNLEALIMRMPDAEERLKKRRELSKAWRQKRSGMAQKD